MRLLPRKRDRLREMSLRQQLLNFCANRWIVKGHGPFQQHLPHRGGQDAMMGEAIQNQRAISFLPSDRHIREDPDIVSEPCAVQRRNQDLFFQERTAQKDASGVRASQHVRKPRISPRANVSTSSRLTEPSIGSENCALS